MQRPPGRRPGLKRDQSTGLQFPILPFDHNLDHWLRHSELITRHSNSSMASLADDSSADENASSVGGSTWDMVDEASAASEDEDDRHTIPRNRHSDSIENLHLTPDSFSRKTSSRPSPNTHWDAEPWRFENIKQQDLQDAEGTPSAANHTEAEEPLDQSGSASSSGLRLDEILADTGDGLKLARAVVADIVTNPPSFNGEDVSAASATGSVAMGMEEGGLVPSETFKLLYIGPREMKPLITQKIGSALAANPRRLSFNDGLDSSRVTVVPVSALFDDSNPEVVMIESGGYDMNIEECVNAFQLNDGRKEVMILDLDSERRLESRLNLVTGAPHLSHPELAPDLAIFYQPVAQSVHDDLRAYWAEKFLKQHNVPFYSVSHDGDWLDPSLKAVTVSSDIAPHRRIESSYEGSSALECRIPINLSSFLALDAGQLHHNILALKTESAFLKHETRVSAVRSTQALISRWMQPIRKKWHSVPAPVMLKFVLPSITVAIMLGAIFLARYLVASQGGVPAVSMFQSANYQPAQPTVITPRVESASASLKSLLKSSQSQLSPKALSTDRAPKRPAEPSGKAKPPRGTLVQVIGGSHILIRPAVPTKQAHMTFEAKRDNKVVPSSLKSFDGEYYVLEIPSADAFGLVEIHIRSKGRPRFEEKIEVDLGSPWFKLKHWQDLAQSFSKNTTRTVLEFKEQVLESTFASWVVESLQNRNPGQQFREGAASFLKEAARFINWSSSTFSEHKKANLQRLRWLRKSWKMLRRNSASRSADMTREYAKAKKHAERGFDTWNRKLKVLKKAMQNLGKHLQAEGRQFQAIRSAQKKLLHAWWNIRGRPVAHRR